MFLVPQAIRQQRLDICKGCKWYKPSTRSCGTLIIGGTVTDENTVSHYRKKIKLCGCPMPHKVKYTFAKCPADKWGMFKLDEDQFANLKKFVLSLQVKYKLEDEVIERMFRWKESITGKREPRTRCERCIRDLYTELLECINENHTK